MLARNNAHLCLPMNAKRDNSRSNFVILLNNVIRYLCQRGPIFSSLERYQRNA